MRENYDDEGSTGESEDKGSYDIDVEEDREDDDDSTENHVLVFETYCHNRIRNVWWGAVVNNLSDVLR